MAGKECTICCKDFTTLLRRRLECQECKYEFCLQCAKDGLAAKEENLEEFVCFNCNIPFSQKSLKSFFSKTFYNTRVLKYFTNFEIKKHDNDLARSQELASYQLETIKWKEELDKISNAIKILKNTKENHIINKPIEPIYNDKPFKYRKKCPFGECGGFLEENVCGLCLKKICEKCEEEKCEGHECNPDVIKSLEEISKTSVKCPGCTIPVSKINGCNQMWCKNCKTVFDYKTLKIQIGGHIHNPEYNREIRENGGFIPRPPGAPRMCDDIELYSQHGFYNFRTFCGYFGTPPMLEVEDRIKFGEVIPLLYDLKTLIFSIKTYSEKNLISDEIKIIKWKLGADIINKKITKEKRDAKLKFFVKTEEANNELREICNSFIFSLHDILSNCVEKSREMKKFDSKFYEEQLGVLVPNILEIHNSSIYKNRADIGITSLEFKL